VLESLDQLPVSVLVATAGRANVPAVDGKRWVADYLPGSQAACRSQLVISNGGSATTYQALTEGVPVLGIPTNMDQFHTQGAVRKFGAGLLMRAGQVQSHTLRDAVTQMLQEPEYQTAAQRIADEFARFNAPDQFCSFLDELSAPSLSPVKVEG
jgi:UDP:flavonoid glycosyltransferase YjiC (YdhE family)